MSLATRYRPQRLNELLGQEHVTLTLRQAVKTGNTAQAYLFSGPRGVGKTSTARILAKMLNCESGPTESPCGTCAFCLEIQKGNSTDVIEIDGASHTGVDDIREIIQNSRYLPSHLRVKVFIIDEVHMLSTSAFNALLKVLEEPPRHVVFVLATTDPQKIPLTVLSRCQRHEFKRLSASVIADNLRAVVEQEKIAAELSALREIADCSEGSLRDALTLLEQIVHFAGASKITDAEVARMLGLADRRVIRDLAEALLKKESESVIRTYRRVCEGGYDLKRTVIRLVGLMRGVLVARVVPNGPELWEEFTDEIGHLKDLFSALSVAEIDRTLALLIEALKRLSSSDTPDIVVEAYLIKACELPPLPDIRELIRRVEQLSVGGSAVPMAPSPAPVSAARPPVVAPPAVADPVSSIWEEFIQYTKAQKPSLAGLLSHVSGTSITPDTLRIRVGSDTFYYRSLSEPTTRAVLEQLLTAFFKRPMKCVLDGSDARPERSDKAAAPSGILADRTRELLSNPVVQETQRLFDAKVEEVKILGVRQKSIEP